MRLVRGVRSVRKHFTSEKTSQCKQILSMETITIQQKLSLKKAGSGYFYSGRQVLWGTIFYLQRQSDPSVFDGPFALGQDHISEMKTWLDAGVVWVKDNFKDNEQ